MHMHLESQASSFFFILFALLVIFVQLANCDGDEEHTSPPIPTPWRTAAYSKKSTISSHKIQTSVDKQQTWLEMHFVSSPRYFFSFFFLFLALLLTFVLAWASAFWAFTIFKLRITFTISFTLLLDRLITYSQVLFDLSLFLNYDLLLQLPLVYFLCAWLLIVYFWWLSEVSKRTSEKK